MIAEIQAILRMTDKDWGIVVAVTAVVALLVSVGSFVVSFGSLRVSSRALRLSEQQEQRKQPRLVPRLLDSDVQSMAKVVASIPFRCR